MWQQRCEQRGRCCFGPRGPQRSIGRCSLDEFIKIDVFLQTIKYALEHDCLIHYINDLFSVGNNDLRCLLLLYCSTS